MGVVELDLQLQVDSFRKAEGGTGAGRGGAPLKFSTRGCPPLKFQGGRKIEKKREEK